MHIAHVVPTYPPYRGGVGHLTAEYATRLRARGHTVHVFTPRYQHTPDDDGFVHRLRTPLRLGNAAFVPSLITRLSGFDLVHLHYPFFGGAEPVLLRKWLRPGQPLVLSYHMDAVADGFRGALFRLHARHLLPRLVARADRVLVSSADYASHSALAGLDGVLSRVEVHAYGVDTVRFHPGGEPELRERLRLAPDVVGIIFVSRLDPAHHFKGLPILLDALSSMRAPPWRLVVVGDGVLREGFEGLAGALGIADRVYFAGDVSDADLPAYYRASDVHVCPSTEIAEAFSLVTLEAAASGVPTLASSLPGVRTVVLDGDTGVHVPPRDPARLHQALRSLIEQDALRARLGRAARARAEAFCQWGPLIDRLEHTYQGTIIAGGVQLA
jgi:glycosyltransferase involved in cell wall biosynthesis